MDISVKGEKTAAQEKRNGWARLSMLSKAGSLPKYNPGLRVVFWFDIHSVRMRTNFRKSS
jgi:hypothetical protein